MGVNSALILRSTQSSSLLTTNQDSRFSSRFKCHENIGLVEPVQLVNLFYRFHSRIHAVRQAVVGGSTCKRTCKNKSADSHVAFRLVRFVENYNYVNTYVKFIAQMDGDVEVDIDPADAENDALAVENGSIGGSTGGSVSALNLSPFNSNWSSSQPRSRDASFEAEVKKIG